MEVQTEIMKGATDFHHGIPCADQAQATSILDDATAFDTSIDMFNAHTPAGELLVEGLLFGGELLARRLSAWRERGAALQYEGEKA